VEELVPQRLELEHLVGARGVPQHVDDLAVDPDRTGGPRLDGCEHAAQHAMKLRAIERAIGREGGQRGLRVEEHQPAARGQRRRIEIGVREHVADRREVLGARDRDRRAAGPETTGEVRRDLGGKKRQIVVELGLMGLWPPRTRRHRPTSVTSTGCRIGRRSHCSTWPAKPAGSRGVPLLR
jgi:hypothetical protein